MSLTLVSSPIVTPEWLLTNIQHPDLIVLDASLGSTVNSLGDQLNFSNIRIPGSVFFDLENKFSDRSSKLPHMMIPEIDFTSQAQLLGIKNDSQIVIYDSKGNYSSPRVRWMFKAMGHSNVAVLDGGLPAWVNAGFSTEIVEKNNPTLGNFQARHQNLQFCDQGLISKAIGDDDSIIIDARPEGRFLGLIPEPRTNLRSGNIPSSVNIPFENVLKGVRFHNIETLQTIFKAKVNSNNQRLIFSCGSGITACIVALAAEISGYSNITVYDGSWCEWGSL
jgi:thiosulfate/3-mercaptopyruvate sulfurtransferase